MLRSHASITDRTEFFRSQPVQKIHQVSCRAHTPAERFLKTHSLTSSGPIAALGSRKLVSTEIKFNRLKSGCKAPQSPYPRFVSTGSGIIPNHFFPSSSVASSRYSFWMTFGEFPLSKETRWTSWVTARRRGIKKQRCGAERPSSVA
ncbi:MAG: hypothetical protein JWM16_2984 [Verrucomicrobiales bacterium]|nr:hypothetical protein [Verrucomicrobiales bacterium]